MSNRHPIIAVTGSSGAGTSTVKLAFDHICMRESINAIHIEGDSFHRFGRGDMQMAIAEQLSRNKRPISHFGPEGNLLGELERCFLTYSETGICQRRHYIHNEEEAEHHNVPVGAFTNWFPTPPGSDLLLYEGLHGGFVGGGVDVAKWVDLLIGVVPVVNLEWIQKIHRDMKDRGYSMEAVTDAILRRMYDYVHHICPQFSRTHINFQRVPLVDTSNPFSARDIPTLDESFVVIRFRNPTGINFPYLLNMLQGSFMTRPNCIVVPGGKMGMAMQLILTPLILELMDRRRRAMPAGIGE